MAELKIQNGIRGSYRTIKTADENEKRSAESISPHPSREAIELAETICCGSVER